MTVASALQRGRRLLEEGGVSPPQLTAEVLLCLALGCERQSLYAHPDRVLASLERLHYERYLDERLQGKPTQYITGRQEFYGRMFRVSPAVMIPRPETEHVIETALALAPAARSIADAGCGSGAIAVTLALETGACVVATDISDDALDVAARNARRLRASVHCVRCDLLAALRDGSVDLVVSNPPYVPEEMKAGLQQEVRDYEPHVALFGGSGGLDFYRRLAAESPRVLRPGGWLIVELGIQQLDAVREMLTAVWRDHRVQHDLAGLPRVLAAHLAP